MAAAAEPFGRQAARLAGVAGRELGWRPAEFWMATPAELRSILSSAASTGVAALSPQEFQHMLERER